MSRRVNVMAPEISAYVAGLIAISGLQALDLLSQVEPHLRSYKRIRQREI